MEITITVVEVFDIEAPWNVDRCEAGVPDNRVDEVVEWLRSKYSAYSDEFGIRVSTYAQGVCTSSRLA